MGFRLIDYLLKNRRKILSAAIVFAAAALIGVLLADPVYESKAMLMPPAEEGGEGLLSAWMASLNLPSAISPMAGGGGKSAIMVDILSSRALAEKVIGDLDLREWYGESTMDGAVRTLRARVDAGFSQTGIITLSVRDREPEMAMRIATAHIAVLDSINLGLQADRAGATLEFTREQIEEYRTRLEESREKTAAFQKEHGIIDFDEQVKGAMEIAAALKVRAALARIEIEILRESTREESVDLKRKTLELRHINSQLEMIMKGDSSMTVFVPLEKLPALHQEYASLQRDLEVNERVYSFLLQKHQESGIELSKNTPSVQVVDTPGIPEKRAGMPRWAVVLLAFAAGGIWMSLMLAWWGWTTMKERTDEESRALDRVVEQVKSDIAAIRARLRF